MNRLLPQEAGEGELERSVKNICDGMKFPLCGKAHKKCYSWNHKYYYAEDEPEHIPYHVLSSNCGAPEGGEKAKCAFL